MKNCTQRTRCSKLITVSSMRKRAHFCICYASCGASHGGFIFMLLVLLLCGWLLAIASTQNTFVGRLMPSTHTLPIADFATEWFFFSTRSSHSTYIFGSATSDHNDNATKWQSTAAATTKTRGGKLICYVLFPGWLAVASRT